MSLERILPPAAVLGVPVALVLIFFGQFATLLLIVALTLMVMLIVLLIVTRSGRGRSGDVSWATPAIESQSSSEPARGSVTRALAPVEGRELLLSPWFAGGAGFCVLLGVLGAQSFELSWWGTAGLLPLLVHPLCGLVIVAVHRNVTRPRRDGADELFESCPASVGQRTAAHLAALVVPVAAASMFVVATLFGARLALDHIYGPIDGRVIGDAVLAGVVLPAGATALGVLLGRRAPFALAPFVALAVIAVVNLEFWDDVSAGRGWLATGLPSSKIDLVYLDPPVAGRLIWTVGLVIVVAGLAFTSSRWSGTKYLVTFGASAAVIGLVVTTRPLGDATADRLAEYVIAPAGHEVCDTVTDQVEVCALEPYRDHGADIAARVADVAASIPDGALSPPVTMRLLIGAGFDELQDEVRERIAPTPIPLGTVALPFNHQDSGLDEARFILASVAVGLPLGPDAPENLLVPGQARGVVALWLAAAGLTPSEAFEMLEPDEHAGATASARGHVWPGVCSAAVQWAPQDVAAARSLVAADRAVVARVISADWARWTSPGTPTDELLAAAGLPPVGPPDRIEPLGGICT